MRPSRQPLYHEPLEDRLLLSVTMTDYEQLMLYYVNRVRVDPATEADRYGIKLNDGLDPGTISSAPKQPLIPNQILHDVAAGYPTTYVGENISWEGTTGVLDRDSQVAARHESLFRSPGHRPNILHDLYQEIGVGIRFGPYTDSGTTYNAAMVTQNFGRRNGDSRLKARPRMAGSRELLLCPRRVQSSPDRLEGCTPGLLRRRFQSHLKAWSDRRESLRNCGVIFRILVLLLSGHSTIQCARMAESWKSSRMHGIVHGILAKCVKTCRMCES